VEKNITNLVLIKPDGSDPKYLTSSDNSTNYCPVWSHDGSFVAFQLSRDLPPNQIDLWIMKADGSDPQVITSEHKGLNRESN